MRFSIGKYGLLAITSICLLTAIIGLAGLTNTTSFANDGLTSDVVVHRTGLTVDWFTHSGAGANGKLADWYINVNENKSTTFFTIRAGTYREKFSQHTLNPFGKPYGIDGAMEYAQIRKEILLAEFANEGIKNAEIKIDEYVLPETTVYALTRAGTVRSIDGDTGETRWSVQIGDPRSPSIGIGANNDYVAAINGSNLFCLEAATGKQLWSAQCRYAVGSSPTVADDKIYVPLINGRLESFNLADKGTDPYAFVSMGSGTARPLVTEKIVAWPTDRGDLNVASRFGDNRGVAYLLHSDNAIISPAAYKEGIIFVTSLDGFVYAIDEDRGTVIWQVSTGYRISHPPMPLGNFVFVINGNQEMYKFDAKTGLDAPGWEEPLNNVDRFLGASKNNMYILDRSGHLKVLSQDSGAVISSANFGSVQSILPNLKNDRLYVVSDRGMIQCIREIGSPIPHFHANEFFGVDVDPDKVEINADGSLQPKSKDADLDDPFKTLDATDNPFGGGNKTITPGSDADPFKGAGGKSDGTAAGGDPTDDGNPF